MDTGREEPRGEGEGEGGVATRQRPSVGEARRRRERKAGRRENTHLTVSAVPHALFPVSNHKIEIPSPVLPDPARRSTTVGGLKTKRESSSSVFSSGQTAPALDIRTKRAHGQYFEHLRAITRSPKKSCLAPPTSQLGRRGVAILSMYVDKLNNDTWTTYFFASVVAMIPAASLSSLLAIFL